MSRLFPTGAWYVRPGIELAGSLLHVGAFNESGAGPLSLRVQAQDEEWLRLRPAVEVGVSIPAGGGSTIRPSARVGVDARLHGGVSNLSASFEGEPTGITPFTIRTPTDDHRLDVQAGLEWTTRNGTSFRLGYQGQYGSTSHQHSAGLKLIVPF
jgi:outer membrane autotransporter protein